MYIIILYMWPCTSKPGIYCISVYTIYNPCHTRRKVTVIVVCTHLYVCDCSSVTVLAETSHVPILKRQCVVLYVSVFLSFLTNLLSIMLKTNVFKQGHVHLGHYGCIRAFAIAQAANNALHTIQNTWLIAIHQLITSSHPYIYPIHKQ